MLQSRAKSQSIVSPHIRVAAGYLWTLGLIGSITLINLTIQAYVGVETLLLAYFLGVLLISIKLAQGPVILSSGLAALAWNLFFVEPIYTLEIHASRDLFGFILFFVVALLAAYNTNRLRRQVRLTRIREERLAFLLATTAKLGELDGTEQIVSYAEKEIRQRFGFEPIFIFSESIENLSRQLVEQRKLTNDEKAAAHNCLKNRAATGQGTAYHSHLAWLFIPLLGRAGPLGILAIRLGFGSISKENRALLVAFIDQIALMIDRDRLLGISQRLKTNEEIDRLYTTILNLITHELRTPLSIIKGVLTAIHSEPILNNKTARTRLADEAELALLRLDKLIDNLIDMSRLESGKLKLNLDWCDPTDILNSALSDIYAEFGDIQISVRQEQRILARLDYALIERVFYNLIKNAILYSTHKAQPVATITVTKKNTDLALTVADEGDGLPTELAQNPFSKFAKRTNLNSGIGIGLSIVKGIIELHAGTIDYLYNNGAEFKITLPLTEANSRELVN